MARTLKIKKAHVRNVVFSFILGFSLLYILEHFGKFQYIAADTNSNNQNGKVSFTSYVSSDTPVSSILYSTFFDNQIRTAGNGFTVGDLNYAETSFDQYSTKSYYYTQATLKDYKYGLYISLIILLLSIFLTEFKIKLI
jgi:hypothetical protein